MGRSIQKPGCGRAGAVSPPVAAIHPRMAFEQDPTDPAAPGARGVRIKLRGLDFAALEWGEPGGTPVVFLHGFLDHAGGWSRVAERLPGWRLALDLRGHGRSAWNGPGVGYHFPEYVADLDALVGQLGGAVRLVGHSMGGTIATLYAGARPDRVERLVLVDGLGLPDGGESARERMVQFLDGIQRPRALHPYPSIEEAARRLRAVWPGVEPGHARELALRGTRAVADGYVWSYDPRHRVRAAVPYRQDQHVRFLSAVRCPVLSVRAERSIFAAEDVRILESALPDLRAHVVDAGLMVQLEAPAALATLLGDFLHG